MYPVLSKKIKFNILERNITKGHHYNGHFDKAKCKNK